MNTAEITQNHPQASAAGPFLTERELAARWHVHPGSLANARSAGRSPVPYTKVLGRILYAVADVEAVEREQAVAA